MHCGTLQPLPAPVTYTHDPKIFIRNKQRVDIPPSTPNFASDAETLMKIYKRIELLSTDPLPDPISRRMPY